MRKRGVRFLAVVGAPAIALGLLLAPLAGAHVGASTPIVRVRIPELLVSDRFGHLLIIDGNGRIVRRLHTSLPRSPQALELAPDRRHAFVSIVRSERPARLYELNLATGRTRELAKAISPTLSPDKTRLAYVSTEVRADIIYRTALVIRSLRSGARRVIPFGPGVPLGTPPELVINWSPDGREIAVFDGSAIRLVDLSNAVDVPSQPGIPDDPLSRGDRTSSQAPVFVNPQTLVVLTDCCIGPQHLVAIDLRSGTRTPFANLSSPAEHIRRLRRGLLLTVTALNELVLVSRGHARVIRRGITAAAG